MTVSINAASAAGAGTAIMAETAQRDATLLVSATPGSGAVVALEGTVDGTNWITVGESVSSGGYINSAKDGPVCSAFRANLKSIIAGTVTASVVIGSLVAGATAWVRPPDWPAMPDSQTNYIDVLAAVTNDGGNYCSVKINAVGGYTVNWGDGTVENVASGVQRDHQWNFADADLGPVTSRGYKTAMIRIYPQVPANPITMFDLTPKHAAAGLSTYSNPWLDIQVNAPSATLMYYSATVWARIVERINIIAIGAVNTLGSTFQNCSSLQSISFPPGSLTQVTAMSSTFNGCMSLLSVAFPAGSLALVNTLASAFQTSGIRSVVFPAGSMSLVTTMANMFSAAYGLRYVSFPAGALVSTTIFTNAFQNCASLQSVIFPAGSFAAATLVDSLFNGATSLQYIAFPAGSLSLVTSIANIFNNCLSLRIVEFPAGAFGVLVTTTTAFGACTNVEKIVNCTIPVTFTLPCNLSAAELDAVYTSLPVAVAKTLTASANYGYAASTQAIATGKGWALA